jgi:hypothetical protein
MLPSAGNLAFRAFPPHTHLFNFYLNRHHNQSPFTINILWSKFHVFVVVVVSDTVDGRLTGSPISARSASPQRSPLYYGAPYHLPQIYDGHIPVKPYLPLYPWASEDLSHYTQALSSLPRSGKKIWKFNLWKPKSAKRLVWHKILSNRIL